MENKMKKTIALGAVIMLCAVAVIGVGYAAFTGNARTYNEGNAVSSELMTLTPGTAAASDWSAITSGENNGKAYFSTYTYNAGTPASPSLADAYYFQVGTTTVTIDATGDPLNGYTVAKVGAKTFTLKNETSAEIESITLKVVQNAPTIASGNFDEFKYILKVGDVYKAIGTAATTYESGALSFNVEFDEAIAVDGTGTFDVELYIGYLADKFIPTTFIGAAVGASDPHEGYTPAKASAVGPVDVTALSFGFSAESPDAPEEP